MSYADLPEDKAKRKKEYQKMYQLQRRLNMTEEDRQKRNDYIRMYRILNRDKINGYVKKWKINLSPELAEERKKKQKEYYEKNKELISQRAKDRWKQMSQEQRDKNTAAKKQRYRIWYFLLDDDKKRKMIDNSRQWIENNKELHTKRANQYYLDNKKKKDEFSKVPTAQPG